MGGDGQGEWGRTDRPRENVERDIEDEIAFHVETRVRENEERGMDPAAARAEAERRFGDVEGIRDELRRAGRVRSRARARGDLAGDLIRDVRLAARTLRRRPVFALVTALILALGTGASTAVFSVANWVLLRPVPGVKAPDSLVSVTIGTEDAPRAAFVFAHRDYLELRDAATALAGLAASQEIDANVWLPGADTPRRLPAAYVSDDFAAALGLRALAGRALGPEDRADPHVTMISEHLWATLFGRARAAIGASLRINGAAFTVVGVAPRGFRGTSLLNDTELWVPVEAHDVVIPQAGADALSGGNYPIWLELVGRLRPGATLEQAAAQLRATAARLGEEGSRGLPHGALAVVRPGIGLSPWEREQLVAVFRVLGAAVALLLLLACANAANLFLARTGGRSQELAVRRAIGAGRQRLVRLLLAEAAVLVVLAGAAGVAIATGALRLFEGARFLTFMPPMGGIRPDDRVLLFAVALSVVTGLAFGVVPSLLAGAEPGGKLRSGRGSVRGTGPSRLLVVAQVAVSAMLLVVSGLLVRTTRALAHTDLGFGSAGVLEASVDPGAQGYDETRRADFFRELLADARALPDVRSAGLSWIPVQGRGRAGDWVRPEGVDPEDARAVRAQTNQVSPGFVRALGLELIAGRDFRGEEMFSPESAVVLVSESAVRVMFPDGAAVGRRIDVGRSDPRTLEIVGVVRDARLATLKEPGGAIFLEPLGQPWLPDRATLYVRGARGAAPAASGLERTLRAMDPALPFYDVQPLARRMAAGATMERILARLTVAFAAIALILAAAGLYGMMAMLVQGRTREMGVRLALGARPDDVRSMILRHGMTLSGVGVAVGLLASTQAGRLLGARLWGVSSLDPFVFAAATAVLVATALAACWGPAVRATRVDPSRALSAD